MGTTIAALNTLATLASLMANIANSMSQVSAVVSKAQAEGRTSLTDAEWKIITDADNLARQTLVDAITKALLEKKS